MKAIEVHEVSKRYARNASKHLSYGLGDLVEEVFARKRREELRKDEFWALRHASFTVEAGGSMALVGENGSGKTTLLKIIHGLVKPDSGKVIVRGKVQAMINLQAGFNLALSGRENVLSAAALHGLSGSQSHAILDEVIAFSELEAVIDSPVGTYSSGMKARLGFAVSTALQPDVLLIDEVLSVGDAAFKRKCMVRMKQLSQRGTTIIFVSHSEPQIVALCEQAVWLHRGQMMRVGGAEEVVRSYLDFLENREQEKRGRKAATLKDGRGGLYGPVYESTEKVDEIHLQILIDGKETDEIPIHSAVTFRFGFNLKVRVEKLFSTLNFHRRDGLKVAAIASMQDDRFENIHHGRVTCDIDVDDFCFVPGGYVIMMPIADGQSYLWRSVIKEFTVTGNASAYFGALDLRHTFCAPEVE